MKIVNAEYIEELKKIVKNSPYPRHMAMEIDHIEFDKANIIINLADYHMQPFGIVHGGVIATMIDTATFWATFLRLSENDGLVNVDLKLNYLQPVIDGRLMAKATCMRHGNSISYSEAKVFDENEKLVAHGTSTLMVQPGKGLKLDSEKFL
jgi:uncharacterized protein (TIGR00369 family)